MSITVKRIGGRQSGQEAETAAFTVGGRDLRYPELEPLSNGFARLLLDAGCMKSDRICLFLDNPVNMLVCMLGIIKIGAVVIPLSPAISAAGFQEILRRDNVSWIIADRSLPKPLVLVQETYQEEGNRLGFGWLGAAEEISGLYMHPEFISGNLANYSTEPFPVCTVGPHPVYIDYSQAGND